MKLVSIIQTLFSEKILIINPYQYGSVKQPPNSQIQYINRNVKNTPFYVYFLFVLFDRKLCRRRI